MTGEPGHTDASRTAIELRFLSGSLRGQCRYATGGEVSVGDDPTCDVAISADDHPGGERRHVRICSSHGAWSVHNLGQSMVAVNHSVVAGECRLRSGDVIRLSLAGPELMFSIVADHGGLVPAPTSSAQKAVAPWTTAQAAAPRAVAGAQADVRDRHWQFHPGYVVAAIATVALLALVGWMAFRTTGDSVLSLRPIPEQLVEESQPWVLEIGDYVNTSRSETCDYRPAGTLPEGMQLDDETGHLSWTPSESQGPGVYPVRIEVRCGDASTTEVADVALKVREANTPPRVQAVPDATFALGTKEALEIQIQAVDDDLPRQPIEFRLGALAPTGMSVDRVTGLVRWTPTPEHAGQTHPVEILASDPDTAQSPQRLSFRVTVLEPARETPVESGVTASIYLLVIEEPSSGTLFPFAVACAIRDDLLVTSGTVVQELAKARDKGMALLAIHCLSQKQEDVAALYLKPDYAQRQDRPEEQIYNDVGAVQLVGKSQSVAPLAAAAGATALEQGTPLRCVMPIFEAEPLTRFDNITPTYHNAKVYMVTRGSDTTSAPDAYPRLIALVGALPKNAYGSPLVNEQGQVVAVYVEKADLSNNASLANLVDRYHYAVCLDSLAGQLGDDLSTWLLAPGQAAENPAREKQ